MVLRAVGKVEQLTTLDRNGDLEQFLWPKGTLETLADAIGAR
ncbi:hypothetical protein [Actinoalloteichus hymeniacidonis]|nr:hypothetical protein [Actinoalloteichus hymeniacidonis]